MGTQRRRNYKVQAREEPDQDTFEDCGPTYGSMDWLATMEVWDTLDAQGFESVGFREFCCYVLFIASLESNQMLKCLHQHGHLAFDILSGG